MPATSAPLESVVIQSDGGDVTANRDNDVKATAVKVCVRLRPMLASDLKQNNANDAASILTPRGSRGRGFARDTASSTPKNAPIMRRHTSGLATPSKLSTAMPGGGSCSEEDAAVLQLIQQQKPSWTTHPDDKKRVSQAIHTTDNLDRLADYTFDRAYGPGDSTDVLYDESIRQIVSSVVDGYHGSIFAYGQTSSGKTHTMSGSRTEEGVVRMAVQDIFNRIQSQQQSNREYLVRVSYLEIYNEQIYDLLAPAPSSPSRFKASLQHHHLPPSTSVRIFESRTEGVVVRGLKEEIVQCPSDVFALLDIGDSKRKVGSTSMNKTSSRSHSLFRIILESRVSRGTAASATPNSAIRNSSNVPGLVPSSNSSVMSSDSDSVATGRSSITQSLGTAVRGPVRISSLSLVDLAGSESAKNTGAVGTRQKEGQYINKSLLTLGHVIHKLSEISTREKKAAGLTRVKDHIPYRDSKLTRLLQSSLGGNAQVCIICNISPVLAHLEESHNTLKFALRAKKIEQYARITEVADEKTLLKSYREEIEELKRQLKDAKASAADAPITSASQTRTTLDEDSDDDQDDTHVLVSAIQNLESLILKGGNLSSASKTDLTEGPNRALDSALMQAESSSMASPASNRPSVASPQTYSSPHGDEQNNSLFDELHRIQGMLGSVMKKRRGGNSARKSTTGAKLDFKSPQRDAEVEKLRLQLQEQEVASTMRKADSSFLQSQLNEKEELLKDVSVLLQALENRQLELETENRQLKEDLAQAAALLEEGELKRIELEKDGKEKEKG